ncbi:MAG: hypothetical protein HZA30_01370 [Candidatus Omnitrophica bacterium]|nr:hypothetical protein [Candidatus Omnitrophota bacterium]MBI5143705.1 hypothetical protein [Candidatus Omnitrophota bacterium]
MGTRYAKSNKKVEFYPTDIIDSIERLKKVRALNCSPSDIGMNSYVLKRLPFNKLSILTKFL